MTSTRKRGGWVLIFATCLWILLFSTIALFFIFADGGGRLTGS